METLDSVRQNIRALAASFSFALSVFAILLVVIILVLVFLNGKKVPEVRTGSNINTTLKGNADESRQIKKTCGKTLSGTSTTTTGSGIINSIDTCTTGTSPVSNTSGSFNSKLN
jgi:predicted PurR-regulated permease PerM